MIDKFTIYEFEVSLNLCILKTSLITSADELVALLKYIEFGLGLVFQGDFMSGG